MATVSPPWAYTLHLPHDPHAPGIARATLRAVLDAHGLSSLTPTAELLASELLSNAHLHTAGPYALRLRAMEPGRLRVAVWDGDPRVPPGFGTVGAVPPGDAESGRGLHLVRAYVDAVGASVLRELGASKGGKLLWAECQWGDLSRWDVFGEFGGGVVAKIERRLRNAARACVERDAEVGEENAQYGGFDAELDVGPPADPARAAEEVEGRRQQAMSVSPGAWMHPRPRPGHLREIAEKIEAATGLRVQIVGGKLVMSPTPRGKHAGVVWRIRRQLDAVLPDGLGTFEVSSIALPEDPDDYVTPDLIILPTEWMEDDDWLAAPEDAALAVEVISQSEKSRGIRDKADWYAVARVPVLLVVDPRNGTWALHSRPDKGAYRDVLPGKFGESVRLPEPLRLEIATDGFPVYGTSPRGRRENEKRDE